MNAQDGLYKTNSGGYLSFTGINWVGSHNFALTYISAWTSYLGRIL